MGQLIIIVIIIITSQIKLNFAGCLWFVALTGYYYSTMYALSVTVACIGGISGKCTASLVWFDKQSLGAVPQLHCPTCMVYNTSCYISNHKELHRMLR